MLSERVTLKGNIDMDKDTNNCTGSSQVTTVMETAHHGHNV